MFSSMLLTLAGQLNHGLGPNPKTDGNCSLLPLIKFLIDFRCLYAIPQQLESVLSAKYLSVCRVDRYFAWESFQAYFLRDYIHR